MGEAGILSEAESDAVCRFLLYRKSKMRNLIKENRQEFKSIQAWRLL